MRRKPLSLAFGTLATFCIAAGIVFSSTSYWDAQPVEPPDQSLDSLYEMEWVMQIDDRLKAHISFDLSDKTVTFDWVYSYQPEGNLKNLARKKQVISTLGWPTAIAALSDTKLLVGGRSASGSTAIQAWTVVPPTAMIPVGATHIELVTHPIASKDLVFSTSEAGMMDIAWMLPQFDSNGSTLDRVHVQFWDSKNVHSIDLDTGANQIEASPLADVAPLFLPELDQEFDMFSFGMHSTEGFVHLLSRQNVPGECVVLKDYDTDGELDTVAVLTASMANATGLLDSSQYSSY